MKPKIQKINIQTIQTAALLTAATLGLTSPSLAQNVSISPTGNAPDNSAALDIRDYTDKGVLIPRLTTAQRNAIPSPALSLLIFNLTTGCYEFWDGSSWISLQPCAGGCIPLSVGPAAGSHSSTQTSITWNWNAVSTATAYYVNTTNNFATATNIGNTTSYTQSGLSCGQNYTLYVWAQNGCSTSAASVFTFSTSSCVSSAGCGSQVFMAVNMDVGTMINGSSEQNDDSQVEKYCYNDLPANCTTYGGLYQWAEAVGEPYSSNSTLVGGSWQSCDPCGSGGRQGICPSGYHIPTDLEWSRYEWCVENNIAPAGGTSLPTFQGTIGWRGSTSSTAGVGAKLKASASNSPSWDGTNASGFTALPAGLRFNFNGGFGNLGLIAYIWSATEDSAFDACYRFLFTGNWQSYRNKPNKTNAFSVRCLQN
jgi:uncharacterized protein (TIGR02145 family)